MDQRGQSDLRKVVQLINCRGGVRTHGYSSESLMPSCAWNSDLSINFYGSLYKMFSEKIRFILVVLTWLKYCPEFGNPITTFVFTGLEFR